MENSDQQIAEVIAQAEGREITHFQTGVIDSVGRVIGKRYHVSNLKKVMSEGMAFIEAAAAAIDPAGGAIETNTYFDPRRGFADALVRMDASSLREVPFVSEGRGLLLLGQFVDHMAAVCPRAMLDAELDRLRALGYAAYGGFELECAPLAETPDSLKTKTPDAVRPAGGFDRVYSFVHESQLEGLYADLLATAETMGVLLDSAHNEFIHMIEVGLKPETGLRIADNAALYKALAKIVGRRHDVLMSFMAKRDTRGQGCGAHVNLSLRDVATGKGAFYDASAPDAMSTVHRHFIGGLERFLPELFLMVAPNLNSYRRFAPGLFTPLNNSWGINNKTVAFRAINSSSGAARVETRVAGADVNPHLALLAVLVSGRLGLEQKIEPSEPVADDGWSRQEDPNPFPRDFADAIERFGTSSVAREQLGEQFVHDFTSDRHWQLAQFNRTVTDWELRMFYDS